MKIKALVSALAVFLLLSGQALPAQTADQTLNEVNGMIALLREEQANTQRSIQLLNDGSILMVPLALTTQSGKLIMVQDFFESPDRVEQIFGTGKPGNHPNWIKSFELQAVPMPKTQFIKYVTMMAIDQYLDPERGIGDEKSLRTFAQSVHKFVDDVTRLSAVQRRKAVAKLEKRQAQINRSLLTLLRRRDALAASIQNGENLPSENRGAAGAWSRIWSSDWGDITLEVSGSSMTGTFTHKNGKLEGNLSADGKKIIGRWTQTPTRMAPYDAGAFEFTLDAGGKRFTGKWWYGFDTSKNASGGWIGRAKQ